MIRFTVIRIVYKNIIKPILFKFDAEKVHNHTVFVGEFLGGTKFGRLLLKSLFCSSLPPTKHKELLGISFRNPVGLAAGFDYDGHLAEVLPCVGFGFSTVGTVTAQPYEGNQGTRLARLPKSKALFVNKGFKSEGATAVAKRLDQKDLGNTVLGISVGSSNIPSVNTLSLAINDYLTTFMVFKDRPYVKYFEINISCPNTTLTESFVTPENFDLLISRITALGISQPMFIKMPSEITIDASDALVDIALKSGISGFIFSNLVKSRENEMLDKDELKKFSAMKGNFSGVPTQKNSLDLLRHTRAKYKNRVVLIGCGGVFSKRDADLKFDAGADLVQLITGMVYEGPQLISEINC